jgi:hypothetical protein
MKRIATIAMLLVVGQAAASEQVIDVQHDSVRGVTCWIVNSTGISCLPDNSLLHTSASTATDESQAAQASLANTEGEKGLLTATPLPQKKGFQL